MKIGGLNVFSLSDYPGRISAVVFIQGCNFRCGYCHNHTLIPQETPLKRLIPEARFFHFLEHRQGLLEGVVVSGGEPTIQPDLAEFIERIKQIGFTVKLDTNGSNPEIIENLLRKKLLDYIAMDVKAPWAIYDRLTGVRIPIRQLQESIEIIAHSKVGHEFRTTVVEPLLIPEDIKAIRMQVPQGSFHRLQKFNPEKTFDISLRNTLVAGASRSADYPFMKGLSI